MSTENSEPKGKDKRRKDSETIVINHTFVCAVKPNTKSFLSKKIVSKRSQVQLLRCKLEDEDQFYLIAPGLNVPVLTFCRQKFCNL